MSKLTIFNQLKSLALALDGLFKADGQTNVAFHQVTAAVFHVIYDKMESRGLSALHDILSDELNEPEELESVRTFITDVVTAIQNSAGEQTLNEIMNNDHYADQPNRFPSYTINEPNLSLFKGQLVINHSYQKKESLEHGDTVNVILTIDRNDTTQLVHVVQKQLEYSDLVPGRLTNTINTTERHINIGLRIHYTEELEILVKQLNETMLSTLTLETSAKMRIVIPMDIRTSCFAMSLLSDETCTVLQRIQQQIYQAAGDTKNQVPNFYITQGSSPIKPMEYSNLAKILAMIPRLGFYLEQFNLDLLTASRYYFQPDFAYLSTCDRIIENKIMSYEQEYNYLKRTHSSYVRQKENHYNSELSTDLERRLDTVLNKLMHALKARERYLIPLKKLQLETIISKWDILLNNHSAHTPSCIIPKKCSKETYNQLEKKYIPQRLTKVHGQRTLLYSLGNTLKNKIELANSIAEYTNSNAIKETLENMYWELLSLIHNINKINVDEIFCAFEEDNANLHNVREFRYEWQRFLHYTEHLVTVLVNDAKVIQHFFQLPEIKFTKNPYTPSPEMEHTPFFMTTINHSDDAKMIDPLLEKESDRSKATSGSGFFTTPKSKGEYLAGECKIADRLETQIY